MAAPERVLAKSIMLGAAAFHPQSADASVFSNALSGPGNYFAQAPLPVGAVITKVSLYASAAEVQTLGKRTAVSLNIPDHGADQLQFLGFEITYTTE